MELGAITSYIDVAQVTLYAFWFFFAGLVFYLRREDRREGYPLERDPADRSGRPGGDVLPLVPGPKTFILPQGGTATSGARDHREPAMERVAAWPGAPSQPIGDPMRAAVGPGSYAEREDEPELTMEGKPLIVPLRTIPGFSVDPADPDPRGMEVVAADRRIAGVISDLWVDETEAQMRYLEVTLPASATTHVTDSDASEAPAPLTKDEGEAPEEERNIEAVSGVEAPEEAPASNETTEEDVAAGAESVGDSKTEPSTLQDAPTQTTEGEGDTPADAQRLENAANESKADANTASRIPTEASRSQEAPEETGAPRPTVARRVLIPEGFAQVGVEQVVVQAILADQFADVPRTKDPDQITKLEEEKIMAYFAAGTLYAEPRRLEPLF